MKAILIGLLVVLVAVATAALIGKIYLKEEDEDTSYVMSGFAIIMAFGAIMTFFWFIGSLFVAAFNL